MIRKHVNVCLLKAPPYRIKAFKNKGMVPCSAYTTPSSTLDHIYSNVLLSAYCPSESVSTGVTSRDS